MWRTFFFLCLWLQARLRRPLLCFCGAQITRAAFVKGVWAAMCAAELNRGPSSQKPERDWCRKKSVFILETLGALEEPNQMAQLQFRSLWCGLDNFDEGYTGVLTAICKRMADSMAGVVCWFVCCWCRLLITMGTGGEVGSVWHKSQVPTFE